MHKIQTSRGIEMQTLRERERAWAAVTLAACAVSFALCALCWLIWLACRRWPWLQVALPPLGFMVMGGAAVLVVPRKAKGGRHADS